LKGAAARAKAIDWLRHVGIPEPERRIDNYPFQMSGGQKQRVMIAIALAAEPDLLIADEPTTALDVTIQKQILDLLADLQRERKMAMLLITHDLGIVATMAHRIALMYAGEIVEVASVAEFFSRPLHPYAQMLFSALPETAKRGQLLAAIPGTVPALDRDFDGCRFVDRCPRAFSTCRTTPVALFNPGSNHAVRCLLYANALATAPVGFVAPSPLSSGEAWSADPSKRAAPLLEVRDYKVWFPLRAGMLKRTIGYVKAVDGISFSLTAGRTLALVGESGCGKTTAGKAIVQLLRGLARIEGEVRLNGQPLDQLDGETLRRARRAIQMIFQDPFASLNPRLRVVEILEEGLIALRPDVAAGARRERIVALVEIVGLRADAIDRYPQEFSGGQRQRLAIARALITRPSLIVLDEAVSALDVSIRAQILDLLADLSDRLRISYLFISHDLSVVRAITDRVLIMQEGKIVEQGETEKVFANPTHPYTQSLLAATPNLERALAARQARAQVQ
ncbi:MAG: dipeptide ABC transporter ATP-binding protein, partial [Propylenella sp.]